MPVNRIVTTLQVQNNGRSNVKHRPPPPPKAKRIADLVPGLREAHEKHKHDTTIFDWRNEEPSANPRGDMRALAALLASLQHDTPERRALLEAAGMNPDAVSSRQSLHSHRPSLRRVGSAGPYLVVVPVLPPALF